MTKKSTTKPTEHTPAPGLPETAAEVLSATVAAPAATQAAAPPAVEGEQLPSEDTALPPEGEGVAAGAEITGDGTGDLLPPLDVVAIIVTSDIEGFRRAGRPWSRTPTTVLIEELDDAAIIALEAEPLLQVGYVADHAEKAAG